MYNPEEEKEQEEINELIQQEEIEENNPDYQFYITLMKGVKNDTKRD